MALTTLESVAATISEIRDEILDLKAKVVEIYNSQSIQQDRERAAEMADMKNQQQFLRLQQERQMITQLQMEGYTKEEAIVYYQRMISGEKPWLDPEATQK